MLTNHQNRYLRGLAHTLKPVVMLGQHGVSDAVVAETSHCLDDHELIKLKVSASDREQRDQWIETICQQTQSELVQRIGNIAVLYRANPDQVKIILPN